MASRVNTVSRRALAVFAGLPMMQRLILVASILGLIVGGYFFSTWVSQPTYAPLFSNLAASDASAIVDKLSTDNIPYQLADAGQTIMVPKDQVYDLRIKMSGQGLPADNNTGYALLDKQGVTTSEFQQQITYQRALEGELSKTVSSIDGVTSAIVHVAVPRKDVFLDDAAKPTASVLVGTAVGKELGRAQVQAIVHLVSASVENLDPANVTVADSSGKVLSTTGSSGSSSGDQNEQTGSYEQKLNSALQAMLDQAVGPGHAVSTVNAELDFDQTDTTTEKFIAPDANTPPIADSTSKETLTGNGTAVGGVLGPDNIQVPSGTSATGSNYNKETSTRNNAVGKVTEKRKSAPGAVKRLSVAVMLDSKAAAKLDQDTLAKLASSAVGINTARGDTIEIGSLEFDENAAKETKAQLAEAQKSQQMETYLGWGKTAGMVLVVLVLLFLAWRSSRKAQRSEIDLAELDRLDEHEERERALAAIGASESLTEIEAPSPAAVRAARSDDMRSEISAMVESQPDQVAQLLRGWLADRRD